MKTLPLLLISLLVSIPSHHFEVLNQSEIGKMACGPCAIINSFQASNQKSQLKMLKGDSNVEKAKTFISLYLQGPSGIYPDRKSYTDEHGTTDIDLERSLNLFLREADAEPIKGCYPIRKESESSAAFVKRMHTLMKESLDLNFAPLMSVRSVVAEYDGKLDKHVWNGKGGHWIALGRIGDITEDGLGFLVHFSDSISGQHLSGYVYLDTFHKFKAPISFTVDEEGKTDWKWFKEDKCLILHAPAMPLHTSKAYWYQRSHIVWRYVLYRDSE